MEESDDTFVKCLSVPSNQRSLQDISCIKSHFKTIEAIKCYKDLTISEFARIARYEHHEAHGALYRQGDICQSWYIVLSGCVLVGQTMFFPRQSFGHRSQGNLYRYDECIILEETELIVFDYSMDRHAHAPPSIRKQSHGSSIRELDTIADSNLTLSTALLNSPYGSSGSKRSSHASDTSSAFSGCDLQSHGGHLVPSYASDNEDADLDSLSQDISSITDPFYEAIIRPPHERTEADLDTIVDGVHSLAAFGGFTTATKRELCRVMRVAMVNGAGERLMEDGHVHDTWNVVLDGAVEVRQRDGSVREFSRGDCFGVRAAAGEQRQVGDMVTVTTSCLFFCVLQHEFREIIGRNGDTEIPETEADSGRVVLVYEQRDGGRRVVVKGAADKLAGCLIADQSKTDPMFVETFLVTYRVFMGSPRALADRLCTWYAADAPGLDTRPKSTIRKCLILWANNHFADFDDPNADMEEYLERFDQMLSDGPYSAKDRSLFIMACSNNSKTRFLTVNIEKNYTKKLPFRLIGLQRGSGLFVREINRVTCKVSCGLRRGDQILSLANYSWERLDSLDKAIEMLNSGSNCSINVVVKYNPAGFQDVLDDLSEYESGVEYDSPSMGSLSLTGSVSQHGISEHLRSGLSCVITPMAVPRPHEFTSSSSSATRDKSNTRSAHTSPNRQVLRQRSKPKGNSFLEKGSQGTNKPLRSLNNRSCSNPDLKPLGDALNSNSNNSLCTTTQVLKVFRSNSDNKFVQLNNHTTAKESVPLIMKEFSIDQSEVDNYALYLVTVDVGIASPVVKSSRVASYMKDLAGKLALNQRYYLKHHQNDSQSLITDEQAKVLLNEAKVSLTQLSAFEISTRLTLIDFALFKDIQAAEYVNFIMKLPPLEEVDKESNSGLEVVKPDKDKAIIEGFSTGCENYDKFEDLINRESFWPTTEICSETNVTKRADLIKKFIKVAKMCKDLKNFNSLMCIITGLTLTPVSRLKASWDKVPSKYIKIYEELSFLTDMSFNFRQIRQLVSPEMNEPPLIPCLAIHSKDLATIHMGNKTSTKDGLINFEKLRMMASEIRKLTTMCSSSYSLQTILASINGRGSSSLFGLSSPGQVTNPSLDESDATSGISGCSNNSDSYSKKGRSNSVDHFAFGGTLKKKNYKRKSSGAIDLCPKNPKKIYEEWLSTLKVRTYLSNLHVEMNINRLQDLSHSLEPSTSVTSSSTNISSQATTSDSGSTEQTANSKANSTKSSVTITLSQSKPQNVTSSVPVASPSNPTSPPTLHKHLTMANSQKLKPRPQSIFSYQNPEDVGKIMELVQGSKKVSKRRQTSSPNENNGRHRSSNSTVDQSYLRNVPLYNNNNKQLMHELSMASQYRSERGSNMVLGGVTLNLQQPLPDAMLEAVLSDKGYCYPLAGASPNNHYGGDRKKCMKPDLPSYETARAISQHQRLMTNCRPVIVSCDSVSARPPLCPKVSPPQLPSYNQCVARLGHPNDPTVGHKRMVPPPPPPPPRTVTMPPSTHYRASTPSSAARRNQNG